MEDLQNEEWKLFHTHNASCRWESTAHYKRFWWISNHGRVKITTNYNDRVDVAHTSETGGREGQRYLAISRDYGGKYIHKIVANNFIADHPNTEDKWVIDHIDGNTKNNHYTNLQWLTHGENIKKSYRMKKEQQNG